MKIDLSTTRSLYDVTGNITDHNSIIVNLGDLRETLTTCDRLVKENLTMYAMLERVYFDLITSTAYDNGDQTCVLLVQTLEPMVRANV